MALVRARPYSARAYFFQECDVPTDVYTYFIDFQKVFYRVKQEVLVEIFKDNELGMVSYEAHIKRFIRQGCVLSLLLFNVYSEWIFKEVLSENRWAS